MYINKDKICIDGTVKNSKNLALDLKVKSDKIDLSELYKRLKLLVDFSDFKEIENIKGEMLADFSLKGDSKKIKSSGYFKINNGEVITSNCKINNINADIDLSNNVIDIKKAVGMIHNSQIIASGKIDKDISLQLLIDEINLANILPKKYMVSNGLLSAKINLFGDLNNLQHSEVINIKNLVWNKKDNSININKIQYDSLKSKIININNIIANTDYIKNIKVPTLKVGLNNNVLTINDTNIYLPNSKLSLNGQLINLNTKDEYFNFNMNGYLNSKDIQNLKILTGIYPLQLNVNGNRLNQNILSQLYIEKTDIFMEPILLIMSLKTNKSQFKLEDLSLM